MNPNMKLAQLRFLLSGEVSKSQDVQAISALVMEEIKKDGMDLAFFSYKILNPFFQRDLEDFPLGLGRFLLFFLLF